jgi:lysophospholipase L1-like esterase
VNNTPNTRRVIRAALIIVAAGAFLAAGVLRAGAGYGSGELGDWQSMAHGTIGDVTLADGDPVADVLVVGDSITARCHPQLRALVEADGYTFAVNYWSGRPTTPAADWALSLTTKPRVLVMADGSNDLMNPPVMAAQVTRVLTGVPEDTQLLWVDVQAARPTTMVADQRNTGWINAQIRDAGAKVIPWSTWFASNPNRITAYLSPDGVHPNVTTGCAFWAAVLYGQISAAL